MEVLEIVLYLILTIILIALVGVLSWLTYDYFNYKKMQGEKNTDIIKYTDRNDNTIKRDLNNEMNKLYSQNLNYILSTSNVLLNYSNNIGANIYSTSNKLLEISNSNYENNYNYINSTSNQLYTDYTRMYSIPVHVTFPVFGRPRFDIGCCSEAEVLHHLIASGLFNFSTPTTTLKTHRF